jgi:hypothetical protein
MTQKIEPFAPSGVSYGGIAFGLAEVVHHLIARKADRQVVRLAYDAAVNAISLVQVLLDRQMYMLDQSQLEMTREHTIACRKTLNYLALGLDDLMTQNGMFNEDGDNAIKG